MAQAIAPQRYLLSGCVGCSAQFPSTTPQLSSTLAYNHQQSTVPTHERSVSCLDVLNMGHKLCEQLQKWNPQIPVWVKIYCKDSYGFHSVCMLNKMVMVRCRDIVYLACFLCGSHTVAKEQTEIAQNMHADVISGGEGFMTHKSLWTAVHASELKQYVLDGGRGADHLGWCLFCSIHQIKKNKILLRI